MTPTPLYHQNDKDAAIAFAAAHPFAVVAINGEEGPITAMVPLALDAAGICFLGHVARANKFWKAAQKNDCKGVAIFQGGDAYVSPSSYASKKEHGRVVPTWNYMAVEIRGQIEIENDPNKMEPYITALTDKMESHRDLPWQVSDAPSDYIARLSRGIVGFKLTIDDITYVRKLSQDKSEADRNGVIQSLAQSDQQGEQAIATIMSKES